MGKISREYIVKNDKPSVRRCICPKCKGKDLILTELWKGHSVQFYYSNGKVTNCRANQNGDPYKVEAVCDNCGYEWQLKGVTQITDITSEYID